MERHEFKQQHLVKEMYELRLAPSREKFISLESGVEKATEKESVKGEVGVPRGTGGIRGACPWPQNDPREECMCDRKRHQPGATELGQHSLCSASLYAPPSAPAQ